MDAIRPALISSEVHAFSHEAMNSTFHFRFHGIDAALAASLARDCGERVDMLESRLSRFVEGSDIWRINHLRQGETMYISESTHRCLLLALDGCQRSGGLFDITLGHAIARAKAGEAVETLAPHGSLTVHPDVPAVTCEQVGRELDLGGIGKGFALDHLREWLAEWDLPGGGLLTAGASSMLAFGSGPWPIELIGDHEARWPILLENAAISASGTGVQGDHIIHPLGRAAHPDRPSQRVWVHARSAAHAEVWSTALMLIAAEDVPDWVNGYDDQVAAVWVERDGAIFQVL